MKTECASPGKLGARICIILVGCAIWLVGTALPALAYTGTQGGLYGKIDTDNGVRAHLHGSVSLGGSNSLAFGAVRVQKVVDGTSNGQYQAGWLKQGSEMLSSCHNGSFNGAVVERHHDNTSGNYLCNPYTGLGGGEFGDPYRFSVKHVGAGWEALRENGNVLDGPYDLGFPGGYAFAVGEKYNAINSYTMHFGNTGETPWQRYSGSWHTINSANKFNEGGWTVNDPPSPFTISR